MLRRTSVSFTIVWLVLVASGIGSSFCFDVKRHKNEMHDGGRHLPADFAGLEFALLVVGLVGVVAALVLALIAVAAVALLSRLHKAVAADGLARFWKNDIAMFRLS